MTYVNGVAYNLHDISSVEKIQSRCKILLEQEDNRWVIAVQVTNLPSPVVYELQKQKKSKVMFYVRAHYEVALNSAQKVKKGTLSSNGF